MLVDGGRQGEEDPIDVVFDGVVDLKVDVEEERSKHIYFSLIIVDESMILLWIGHSWVRRPRKIVFSSLDDESSKGEEMYRRSEGFGWSAKTRR
ncbi:hypothetical protein M5K25_023697 [Dendrobium thyrsiflorum]|uniref:Uncharacterized protein n=1 Tax=Dendrobium thyrsiflorum TaxID=117978 RepID=A0ABD0U014_DENTH